MVVERTPVPVRTVAFAPELAEIEAVGVPELTLMKPNFYALSWELKLFVM